VAVVRGHRPDLDGLRFYGVVQVMAYHFQSGDLFKGAAINVDLFFALSGYLITGLLVAEREKTGTVNLAAFYWRRAFRLLPALFVLLTIGATAVDVSLPGNRTHGLIVGGVITALYLTDIASYTHDTWWRLYVWTWTLSMEEQFYIIWPQVLRRMGRLRKHGRLVVFGIVIGALLLAELTAKNPPACPTGLHCATAPIDYYQPQAHLFSVTVGCAAAFVTVPRWFRHLALPAFLGVIALGQFSQLIIDKTFLRVNAPAAAVLTVVLILALEHEPRIATALLSFRPLAHIGVISYGLYLYHPAVYIVLTQEVHRAHWVVVILSFVVTWLCAEISYRFFESPIREWGRGWLKRRGSRRAGSPAPS
jgi:peptidoglycan/LPS O-acetylase OafA/YrhL